MIMEVRTRAIVLRSVKYGDGSLIVDMLTRERGRVSFMVRIPKTQKGKLKKQFFQPLTVLALVFDFRQRSSLQHIRDISVSQPFATIPFDPMKISLVMFLAEFLTYATRDEQQNVPLFDFVESSLRWLDDADGGYTNFHLVFMTRLSLFIGFQPSLDDYSDDSLFDLREGCFTHVVPLHHDFLQPSQAHFLPTLLRLNYRNMHLLRLSREQRNDIVGQILYFYRLHVPDMPELRCLDVLKELFA